MSDEFANNSPDEQQPRPASRPSASVSDSDARDLSGATGDRAQEDDPSRDPFEELASEFAERQRSGEMPSVEEYAQAHPELAAEIRELFPTIAAMEQLKERNAMPSSRPMLGGLPLEQLGDFRILGEIGRGGMGVVYEAEQVSLGRHVAVKVLPKQALLDERHLRRFQREAQTAAKLHHTNIVPVFGVGQQDGYHYIVMQFISGVGLDEVLVALRRIVLGDNEEIFAADSSSRASHASHNAKALLDGQFTGQARVGFSASLIKPDDSSSQPQPTSGVTLPMNSTQVGKIPPPIDAHGGSDGKSSPLTSDQLAKLSGTGSEYYRSVAKIGAQVADALRYAHEQGTLHRDIKPGNLLLDSTGTVWVADFGLAKLAEHDNVSRTGDIVGTLAYMAPESFSGETDARADIYSLGITLYEMLVLRPAYHGRDRGQLVRQITQAELVRPRRLNPSLPRDLETIVLKAIAEQPQDRYATAGEFAEDLQRYLDDLPILARRTSPPERLWRWCRRNRLVATLAASVLSLLVLVAVISSVGYFQVRASEADAVVAAAEAEDERRNAVETAKMAIKSLLAIFNQLAPDRLPLSADASLQNTELTEEEETDEDLVSVEDQQPVVAPAPVTEETAAILEIMLEENFDELSKRAGNEEEFAVIFADLTLRVGKVYQVLGKNDEAQKFFDRAISKYEALVSNKSSPAALVGLAMSYNESGRVMARQWRDDDAIAMYRKALELLHLHADTLGQYSRAQYERARTLFLMSVRRPGSSSMAERGRGRGEGRRGRDGGFRDRGRPDGRRGEGPGRGPGQTSDLLAEAIKILVNLCQEEPVPEYRYLLARCYLASLRTRPNFGRLHAEDRPAVENAVGLLEDLVKEHPQVADYRFELAMAYSRSTTGLIGDTVADEALITKSVDLLDDLTAKNTSVSQYASPRVPMLIRLATTLERRADDLEVAGNIEGAKQKRIEAARAYDRFNDARRQFADRFPNERVSEYFGRRDFRFNQARILSKSGEETRAISILEDIIQQTSQAGSERRNPFETTVVNAARLELSRVLARVGDATRSSEILTTCYTELAARLKEIQRDVSGSRREEPPEIVVALFVEVLKDRGESAQAAKLLMETAEKKLALVAQSLNAGNGRGMARFEIQRARLQMGRALQEAGKDKEADEILTACKSELESALSGLSDGNDLRSIFLTSMLVEVLEELGETERAHDLRADLPAELPWNRSRVGGSELGGSGFGPGRFGSGRGGFGRRPDGSPDRNDPGRSPRRPR